jgi:uncharacterized membrane protein YphA (DoxX/SURF4 family)
MDPAAVKQEPAPVSPNDPELRLLRWSVAGVWLLTGVMVLHPTYRATGHAYLSRMGLPDWVMYATCVFEVVLGLRVGIGRASTWVTALQVAMVVTFSLILGCLEPPLLVNPFGALTKNLPLLTVLGTTWLAEREGWTPRALWLLRSGLAAVWLTEGIFPKICFQQADELNMVIWFGVPLPASMLLVLVGVAEVASGVGVLLLHGWPLRWLLGLQLVALVVLPLMAGGLKPDLWVHPFMPLVKNLPIIAGSVVLLRHSRPTQARSASAGTTPARSASEG